MKTIVKFAIGTTLVLAAAGIFIFTIISLTSGSESDICEYASVPTSISVQRDESHLVVSWFEPWPNRECGAIYSLQYRIEAGHTTEVNTTGNRHTIYYFHLEPCSILHLQLTAISSAGNVNPGYITRNYTEIPSNVIVTNIQFTDMEEGLLVTWEKPSELAGCDVHYDLQHSAEFGESTLETNTESVVIPHETFCFRVHVLIRTWVGTYFSSYTSTIYTAQFVQDVNFTILPENEEEVIVTWNRHFKQEQCMLEYEIEMSSDGLADQTFNVTEPEARFNFIYCADAALTIVTYGFGRSHRGPGRVFAAVQYPENATSIVDLRIEKGDQISIIWTVPSLVPTCTVIYNVSVTTDVSSFDYSVSKPPITLPKHSCCFLLRVEIQAVVWLLVGEKVTAEFQIELDPVERIELTLASTPNTLMATWSELPKQELCKIRYLVTYEYGTSGPIDFVITSEATITLDLLFCVATYVQVTAVSGDVKSEKSIATYNGGKPILVDPVQDIEVDEPSSNILRISWSPAASVYYCDMIYTVRANNTEEVAICAGETECGIELDKFCPSVDIVITASSLDGEPIDGVPSETTYICW